MAKPYGGQKPIFHEFISPIGLFVHLYHDRPQLKTKDTNGNVPDIDPETGLQRAEYKVTLTWRKSRINELTELVNIATQVRAEAWPESMVPNAFFVLEPFFRDGDNPAHNTKNKDYLRDCYYLNVKQKADVSLTYPGQPQGPNNPVLYKGAPGLLGPHGPTDVIMPSDLWAGCTGRVSGIMFGTEYAGKNFISVRLNNIQKYDEGDGTRIGGAARPTAASQFGALKDGPPPGAGAGLGALTGQPGAFGGSMFGNAPAAPSGGSMFPAMPGRVIL